ncbi:MAG: hypothetical protein IID17_14690, partial [Nitrospinae bacterium]|nr:hypothetical protein [Nitrospinota bacterium]
MDIKVVFSHGWDVFVDGIDPAVEHLMDITYCPWCGLKLEDAKEHISSREALEKRRIDKEKAGMEEGRRISQKVVEKKNYLIKILSMRRSGMTFKEIGGDLGFTPERARQ